MKDINQLLFLAKNPYYKLMPDEQKILDDFLAKKRAKRSQKSQETNSNELSPNTRVTVRNIVEKFDPSLPEVDS